MEENNMTDKQMKTILKMVQDIIDTSKDKEEASKKIEELLKDYE